MKFNTGYNMDPDANSLASGVNCSVDRWGEECPDMTQQQFKEECDINEIVRRFGITGQLPDVRMPLSGDFTQVSDFHSAMNLVVEAEQQFMLLPPEVREEFGNDPGKVLAFLDDPANREKAEKLGLVARPPERTRDVVQAVDELAAKLTPKD